MPTDKRDELVSRNQKRDGIDKSQQPQDQETGKTIVTTAGAELMPKVAIGQVEPFIAILRASK